MRVLVTGGAGFIGSNFIRYLLRIRDDWEIINLDKLTYAGNLDNLKDIEDNKNYEFVEGDVCDLKLMCQLLTNVDCVFHFAAESHVDNSLGNSLEFTKSNTLGTHTLLEAARLCNVKKIIHMSTDEVYGDKLKGVFRESNKLNPNNPYSGAKAAAEMIVMAYMKTYNTPVIMVRGNNVYGPYHHPEKLIPRCITNALRDKKIPLHGDGSYIRSYIYVEDLCEALLTIFQNGKLGEIYNVGTHDEIRNIELTKSILKKLKKPESLIKFVKDRPFNDKRYSIDLTKIHKLGWVQRTQFKEGLDSTIEWYRDNRKWWKEIV